MSWYGATVPAIVVPTSRVPFFTVLAPNISGATFCTSCPESRRASASKRVSLISPSLRPSSPGGRVETTRTQPEPRSLKRLFTAKKNPWTIETTAITAATPIRIPRIVSIERSLFAQSALRAIARFSRNRPLAVARLVISAPRGFPLRRLGRRRSSRRVGRRRRGSSRRGLPLVRHDVAVAQVDDPPRAARDVVLVGDEDDRVPRL